MNIFFDIDMTCIYPPSRKIRPWTEWCVKHLRELGHTIYLWSHNGWQNCIDVGKKLLVPRSNCFTKPSFETPSDHSHIVDSTGHPISIDYCVDDDPSDMPLHYLAITVLPYCAEYEKHQDYEMLRILDTLAPEMNKGTKAQAYDVITDTLGNPV